MMSKPNKIQMQFLCLVAGSVLLALQIAVLARQSVDRVAGQPVVAEVCHGALSACEPKAPAEAAAVTGRGAGTDQEVRL